MRVSTRRTLRSTVRGARPGPAGRWGGAVLVWADIAYQLLLIYVGINIVFTDPAAGGEVVGIGTVALVVISLVLWCVLASLYWAAGLVTALVSSRRRRLPRGTGLRDNTTHQQQRDLDAYPLVRVISSVATFTISAVGLSAAVQLLVFRNDPTWSLFLKGAAIWAMVLSWALFHWGYARQYARMYRLDKGTKPLEFPGDEEPGLSDFAYFAFTVATAFSTSDVSVMTSRMRWTVLWHSTLSFFFNSIIIVLAVNTVLQT